MQNQNNLNHSNTSNSTSQSQTLETHERIEEPAEDKAHKRSYLKYTNEFKSKVIHCVFNILS